MVDNTGQNVLKIGLHLEMIELYDKWVWRVSGIVVSIAAFQAVDPGSIPGWRIFHVGWVFLERIINIFSKKDSHAGSWTRAFWVKARYPSR